MRYTCDKISQVYLILVSITASVILPSRSGMFPDSGVPATAIFTQQHKRKSRHQMSSSLPPAIYIADAFVPADEGKQANRLTERFGQ
jgi:hypothetical protein